MEQQATRLSESMSIPKVLIRFTGYMYRAAEDRPDLFRHGNLEQVQAVGGNAYRWESTKEHRFQAGPPEAEAVHRVKYTAHSEDPTKLPVSLLGTTNVTFGRSILKVAVGHNHS